MQRFLSRNKGITNDCISDSWLKKTNNYNLVNDLWNLNSLKAAIKSLEARLVPLNKKWSNIPKKEDFRPILILSALVKWLELRFLPKLREHLKYDADPNQIGFVPGCQTQMNIK
jgi:hypothetical protein